MPALVDTVMGPLLRSRRPVLLVLPESAPDPALLVRVAEHLGTPVITTPDRPNAFPSEHPLAGCHATFAWRDLTAAAVEQCDAVLMVGGAPSRFAIDGFLTGAKTFLQICERPGDLSARPVPSGALFGSLGRTLLELCRTCPRRPAPRWFEQLKRHHDRTIVPETLRPSRPGTLHPAAAACVIAQELPPRACISVDVGEHAAFFLQNARLQTDHPTLIAIERSACMGHTFCASIGWGLASGRPTLALVGDGGFRMHSQELHTAVEHGLRGWVAVVWENGGFGMVSHALDMQFGVGHGICSGAWRVHPDLAQLARGWGADACDVHDVASLRAAIRCGFASPGPYVVVAHIDPTIEPPIRGRLKQLPDAVTTDA